MDKVLDKLGIYDILGVFIFGLCADCVVLLMVAFYVDFSYIYIFKDHIFAYVLVSGIVGIVFQELSSLIFNRWIFRNNKLLKHAIKVDDKDNNVSLSSKEIELIKTTVKNKLGYNDVNDSQIFNYCKMQCKGGESKNSSEKDLALAGMARSMSLFCLIAGCLSIILSCFYCYRLEGNAVKIFFTVLITIGLFLLALLFFFRYLRFNKRRIVNIYRNFLDVEVYSKN